MNFSVSTMHFRVFLGDFVPSVLPDLKFIVIVSISNTGKIVRIALA